MSTAKGQIQGWKEIAAYLGRDERTAKRWEKQRGLPVRRIPGSGRANVYVLVAEIELWLTTGNRGTLEVEAADGVRPAGQQMAEDATTLPMPGADAAEVKVAPDSVPGDTSLADGSKGRRLRLWGGVGIAAAVVSVALLVMHSRNSRPQSTGGGSTAGVHATYRSPVHGVDELYLQGVYFLEERTPVSLQSAIKAFSEVVERDPKDAPAYTGLAETYLLQREYATRDSRESYGLAREAAGRALLLDPQLPEAHAVLGFIHFFSDFDAKDATDEFRTAIALSPSSVLAHHWYGSMMTHQGRYAEALEELDQAQRLAPTSTAVISSKAYALGLSGHRDEAIAMLDRVMAVDPEAPSPPRISAHLSMQNPHDVPRFLEQSQRFAKLRHDSEELRLLEKMKAAYRRGDEAAMWTAVEQNAGATLESQPTDELLEAEAELGNHEKVMQMLLELAAKRDTRLLNLKISPFFSSLRDDPRFQKMLVDLNLNKAG